MGAIVSITGEWDPTVASWPWPQVRFLQYYNLGIAPDGTELKLYELSVIDEDWNATEIMTLGNLADVSQVETMDFGPFFTLSVYEASGDVITTYVRNPGVAAGVEGAYTALPSTNTPLFITGCNYNGQPVIAGIETVDPSWGGLDHHSFLWASIGTFDFRYQHRTTAGTANAPFGQAGSGRIWKLRKLGKNIIGYGNEGITMMSPISTPVSGWTVPKDLQKIPPLHHNAIAGNELTHCYIDQNLELWTLTEDGAKNHGFKDFLTLLSVSDILVVHDPKDKKFYISDGARSFVLVNNILYECHQCVTSVGHIRQTFAGFFIDTLDYAARIVTNTLDFRSRGFKTIQCIEMGMSSNNDVSAAINYRKGNDAFAASPTKLFTPDGIVFPLITSVDMQVVIATEDYRTADLSIDYINVKIKNSDKRFRRGTYVADKAT